MEMDRDQQTNINLIEAWLNKAFSDRVSSAYAKLKLVRWAGEHVDVYTNKIQQLAGLPKNISMELQQAPTTETSTMGDLLTQWRVLTRHTVEDTVTQLP